jgi:hypothetical protein
VMFAAGSGHYGAYGRTIREIFVLPDGFDVPSIRGFGVGPRGTTLLMATDTAVFRVTLKPGTGEDPDIEVVVERAVAAITGTARLGVFAVTPESAVLRLTTADDGTVAVEEVAHVEDAPGPPLGIEVDTAGGKATVLVRYDQHAWLDGALFTGQVAFLPGGKLAVLTDGILRVVDRETPDQALATHSGLPATADWIGADPGGGAIAVLAGTTVTAVLLDLADPAYQGSGE